MTYDDSAIVHLEEQEHIRKRPGLYIGLKDKAGLHHLLWEIVDNSIDEALNGYCDIIKIVLDVDGSVKVIDNGRGIPIGKNTIIKNKHNPEVVFTSTRSGGKFEDQGYKFSGGLHGMGAAVTTAFTKWLKIEIWRDGKYYSQFFQDGWKIIKKPKIVDYTGQKKGTTITFLPDYEEFSEDDKPIKALDIEMINQRIEEITFLNKGLHIVVEDKKAQKEYEFQSKNGLFDYIEKELNNKEAMFEKPIYFKGGENYLINKKERKMHFEFIMHYTKNYSEKKIIPFTNSIRNNTSSSHVEGFKLGLKNALNAYAKKIKYHKRIDTVFNVEDVTSSILCILVVYHPNPIFDSQTKNALREPIAKRCANKLTTNFFTRFLYENKEIANKMLENANRAMKIRKESINKIKTIPTSSSWSSQVLVGKLADCSTKETELAELFIVEGNSAGGTAKQARNRETQAILPLRGKIINSEKSKNKIMDNKEILSLITAFGIGMGEEADISKLKYGKIIIMTDADVDGAHIRVLLLTFIYRYFNALIDNDNIYIAKPPLYKIMIGKKQIYAYDDNELQKITSTLDQKYNVQRYKGLGEMNADQLWETTMNPATRTLLKVEVESDEDVDEVVIRLMGSNTNGRKEFIVSNADKISLDEIDI